MIVFADMTAPLCTITQDMNPDGADAYIPVCRRCSATACNAVAHDLVSEVVLVSCSWYPAK